ncbi:hypothetical protein AYI68_g1742 [Smittium mucronatum]|uniref:Uncharacterized protein n=1 Tax=Smittium mucronatum TaxID=133383 RepID=A0A1R0H4Q3_9FUNG|nr:hypothetical protein AYI68_g1742 [Smittium mucronatum]
MGMFMRKHQWSSPGILCAGDDLGPSINLEGNPVIKYLVFSHVIPTAGNAQKTNAVGTGCNRLSEDRWSKGGIQFLMPLLGEGNDCASNRVPGVASYLTV